MFCIVILCMLGTTFTFHVAALMFSQRLFIDSHEQDEFHFFLIFEI